MELIPDHLVRICCEVTLFNRQRWKIKRKNGRPSAERIIINYDGKRTMIHKQYLAKREKRNVFFSQIKLLWFDGKIVAYRGCAEQPLTISNKQFSRLINRQRLLIDAEKAYLKVEEKERLRKNRS